MFTHNFPFDPTYGYDEAAMLKIAPPEPPADFERFWRDCFARALAVPTNVQLGKVVPIKRDDVEVLEINFDAMGLNGAPPVRLGGWLVRPTRLTPVRAEVNGHGYGGRESPDPGGHAQPVVRLQVCQRGFHRSVQPDLPVNQGSRHVVSGIESRDTYVHLGNAADLWAAVKVLAELYAGLGDRIDYVGGSFGGGIGALAMPWDHRVRRVMLDVPSFGNHPLRLTCPCIGSGEAVRQLHLGGHDVMPVLKYFDAATAARFMDKPTLVGCARFDPAVPPPGQFSVYNAIPCQKKLIARNGGHWEYPELPRDYVLLNRATREWLEA